MKIVVIDSHSLTRDAVAYRLKNTAYEVASDVEGFSVAPDRVERLKPDIVIVDIVVYPLGAAGLIREIKERVPKVKVLVFTELNHFGKVFNSGVWFDGLLSKGESAQLFSALETLRAGRTYLDKLWLSKYVRQHRWFDKKLDYLTISERQILRLLVEHNNDTFLVAQAWGSTRKTILNTRRRLERKLGLQFQEIRQLVQIKTLIHHQIDAEIS